MNRKSGIRKFGIYAVVSVFIMNLFYFGTFAGQARAEENFDSTQALIELLKAKGVIDDKEAASFLEKIRLQTEANRQTVHILPAEDQEKIMKEITDRVTQDVTRQINQEGKLEDMRLTQKSSILNYQVEQLKEDLEKEKSVRENSWAQRIRFGGDIRLRHESKMYVDSNATDIEDPSNSGTLINTTNDEHKQRVRLRVGLTATVVKPTDVSKQLGLKEKETINTGQVDVGIRLASGSVGNPVSTNYTMGDDDSSRADIVLDRAYLKWSYKPTQEVWGGKIPQATTTIGIMSNPWYTAYSNLIWDSDLAFEGLAFNFKTDTVKRNPFNVFLTAGYFPIQESEWSQADKYMMGAQAGFSHRPCHGWKYKIAAGFFEYFNVTGEAVTSTFRTSEDYRKLVAMTPKYMQKGNTTFLMDQTVEGLYFDAYSDDPYEGYGLASKFKLLNITGQIDNTYFWPVYITFYWDWVKNMGYDANEMADKIGVSAQTIKEWSGDTGYQLGLRVGYPKIQERWQWSLSLAYRYLESDAVLDAYTDSDFNGGGTNAKGFIFAGELGLMKNVWLKARWMSGNEITDFEAVTTDQDEDFAVDIIQLDLNARF